MGFILEIKNNSARKVKYAKNSGGANSSWMSRNMIWSGLVILAFMVLHFIDFWIPEIYTKYVQGDMKGLHNGEFRYFHELQEKFLSPARVGAYVLAFVFLAMHLLHGFMSAFQSIGANNKYTKGKLVFDGYRGRHSLHIEFPADKDLLNKVLRQIAQGHSGAEVGIAFTVSDKESVKQGALAEAVKTALSEKSGLRTNAINATAKTARNTLICNTSVRSAALNPPHAE